MKTTIFALIFLTQSVTAFSQYTQASLTAILTGGTSKSWTDKATGTVYTFNKNGNGEISNASGSKPMSWKLSSADQLNWNLAIGSETSELIISYAKDGKQYLKLIQYTGGNRVAGYKEKKLFPATP